MTGRTFNPTRNHMPATQKPENPHAKRPDRADAMPLLREMLEDACILGWATGSVGSTETRSDRTFTYQVSYRVERTVDWQGDALKARADAAEELRAALENIVANAHTIPDPSMEGATDIAAVPLDDIEQARAALGKHKENDRA